MSGNEYAFLLSTIAGISTVIGFLFIFIKSNRVDIISKALGFASGVMITVSIIDLIPSSLDLILNKYNYIYSVIFVLVFFVIGAFISNVIDININETKIKSNKLYKIGIISMIVIMLHNIPEDCINYVSQ